MNAVFLRLGAGLLLGLIVISTVWLARDRFAQKELADAATDCDRVVSTDSGLLEDCLPNVRQQVEQARRARLCEAALLPSLRAETRAGVAQSCGAGVKRLVAQSDADQGRIASLGDQLAAARADTAAAVVRAERRAGQTKEREAHGRSVIAAAPHDAAGGIVCDADCLRDLAH